MGATPPTVLYRIFRNFTGVVVMVCKFACVLDIILRLVLLYNPQLNVYQYLIYVYIYVVPLSANAPTVLYNSL